MDPAMVFCTFAGIFCIVCAAKDYDFFMNNHKTQLFIKMFGRNGARVFYIILGLVIMAGALMSLQ